MFESHDVTRIESDDEPPLGRSNFLRMATLFQGGMFLLALFFAWLFGMDVASRVRFDGLTFVWGVVATLPMLLFLWATLRFSAGPFFEIKQILKRLLGKTLVECRWYDLVYVSLLAGLSEEALFRGLIQTGIGSWTEPPLGVSGIVVAVLVTNATFGAAHWLSSGYALMAGLLGVYLSLVFVIPGPPNLIPPMIAHALYDFVALTAIRNEVRRETRRDS